MINLVTRQKLAGVRGGDYKLRVYSYVILAIGMNFPNFHMLVSDESFVQSYSRNQETVQCSAISCVEVLCRCPIPHDMLRSVLLSLYL